MDYFILKPNFNKLSEYFDFKESPEKLFSIYSNGYAITVDYYHTNDLIQECTERFQELLRESKLSEHYDNLMLIILSGLQYYETQNYEASISNAQLDRIQQIAQFLLTFEHVRENQPLSVVARGIKHTGKVTDRGLSLFIGRTIKESIEKRHYLLKDLGFELNELLDVDDDISTVSYVKAREIVKRKPISLKLLSKNLVGELSITLLRYLNKETIYKTSDNALFSDLQMAVLYEILRFFKLIPQGNFDNMMGYESKDFMRSFLSKYLKSFEVKGNKRSW